MSKFSVKKPLTVFVAVIAVLVLGVVAYLKMTPDLLPNMDFPYVMIMTTYPGASPEEVEQEITKPMEQAMSTLENIKEVTSTSAENYSMVLLEFEEDVNMDTIGVDIQQNISMLSSGWDEIVSAPYVLKINPSLLPVMVAAVSMDGKDTIELTQYLDEELMGKLEGIAGVARISTSGTVTQQLHVVLDQNMIDALNKSVSNAINGKMDEALGELQETKEQLVFAQQQMEVGKQQLETGKDQLLGQTAAGEAELSYQQAQLVATRGELVSQLGQIQSGKTQLEAIISVIEPLMKAMQTLQTEADGIAADIEVLLGLLERAEALEKQWQQMQQALEEIRNDTSLTPEEAEKALAQITGSQEYQQLQANLAQLEALLKAYGVTREEIPQRVEVAQAALADIRQRIENIRNLLTQQGIDPDSVGQQLEEMKNNIALMEQGIAAIEDGIAQIDGGMLQLKEAQALLSEQKAAGLLELAAAATEISVNSATVTGALTQIDGGIGTLETTREQTLASADLNNIITMEMLTTLLTAQNFSMPAGTISQDGVNYMLSVGDEISTLEELQNLLLFDMGMEGVAPIYLKDVAAVMVTDNSAQSYAKLDGLDSIMLTFEKQSTFATAETTDNILERFEELEKEHPGLKFVSMMNQGDYIYLIVETILSSLLLGALFAILVLFLFLWDLRPTFITLCSIPISVIFAIVLMYFSGVTINMISLSGLAVSVGMLVDNSVVVIENIYRLRAKGANAIQAAVSGAKQVAGAVVASTLTTVCVFLPIVFVEGITKQLFTDLALTMTFSCWQV
jgi:HAE1 family hydrophobic/amphiphilic exporter-1